MLLKHSLNIDYYCFFSLNLLQILSFFYLNLLTTSYLCSLQEIKQNPQINHFVHGNYYEQLKIPTHKNKDISMLKNHNIFYVFSLFYYHNTLDKPFTHSNVVFQCSKQKQQKVINKLKVTIKMKHKNTIQNKNTIRHNNNCEKNNLKLIGEFTREFFWCIML